MDKENKMKKREDKYSALLEKITQLNDSICELKNKVNTLRIMCHNVVNDVEQTTPPPEEKNNE
jgi:hypothetical protein